VIGLIVRPRLYGEISTTKVVERLYYY